MLKNTLEVAKAFLKGEHFSKCRSISTDGEKIFSYSTPIAWRDGEVIVITPEKYSVTTSRQQADLKTYFHSKNYETK